MTVPCMTWAPLWIGSPQMKQSTGYVGFLVNVVSGEALEREVVRVGGIGS